ncbi:hypothetical protein Hanom_Chr12g01134581 [Helianthus anomalus]
MSETDRCFCVAMCLLIGSVMGIIEVKTARKLKKRLFRFCWSRIHMLSEGVGQRVVILLLCEFWCPYYLTGFERVGGVCFGVCLTGSWLIFGI